MPAAHASREEDPMLRSVDPATGKYHENHAEFSPKEVQLAILRAREAFETWRTRSFADRAACLVRAATQLREEAGYHAELMASEMGKPVREGRAEAEKCAWVCEYYAEHGEELLAPELVDTDAIESWVQFDPLGPVLAVMPWNFPYWQVFRFAAPALMAGNAGLLKHASNVPRCAQAIEDVWKSAELPNGLFQNLPLSSRRISELVDSPEVRAVTLTGSERAGSKLAASTGRALKKIVLELGGSDPFIVLDDVRVAQVAAQAARARTINNGQSCIAAKRFLVAESLEKSFIDALQTELERLTVGDPRDEETDLGPLAGSDLLDNLERQVEESVAEGARVVTGGRRLDRDGYFYPPTLLADVRPGMPVADDETFGPVAAVIPVADEEQAIEIANASRFGLGASVWTRDRARGVEIAGRLEAGCVAVNGIVKSDPRLPFGGVKQSGYGRELGKEGIREFVNVKSVWVGEPA
jgi:succinate-semialdehyde dehydrogenase/glutarate-semialdehyde dehydrogenase